MMWSGKCDGGADKFLYRYGRFSGVMWGTEVIGTDLDRSWVMGVSGDAMGIFQNHGTK